MFPGAARLTSEERVQGGARDKEASADADTKLSGQPIRRSAPNRQQPAQVAYGQCQLFRICGHASPTIRGWRGTAGPLGPLLD